MFQRDSECSEGAACQRHSCAAVCEQGDADCPGTSKCIRNSCYKYPVIDSSLCSDGTYIPKEEICLPECQTGCYCLVDE